MRADVDEVGLAGPVGPHEEVIGGWQVAEYAGPLRHPIRLARGDVGEPPDGHVRPVPLCRKEVPVAHRIAHQRVGDVVRGEAEAVDAEQHLAVGEIGRLGVFEAGLVEVVFADLEVDLGSLSRFGQLNRAQIAPFRPRL